jgi:branched-chain amino acid transport system permease protein
MSEFVAFTIVGIVIGSAYAIAASGLVITYATSNVFNMAHGAIGMVMAFLYWELAVNQGLPSFVALLLVVGVAAPLAGALIERTMMRRLTEAPATVSLTVTVGLLVGLIGLAQSVWPAQGRRVEPFFFGSQVQLGRVTVTGHEILTFVLALAVAGGLYYLLARTRTGVGMRAIVDNRMLLSLHGAKPRRLGMLSWALGASLAALAGILLIPTVQLDYISLTLLVINAYAAAMVGRLKNLPRTIIGALALGLLQSYFLLALRYLPDAFTQQFQPLLQGIRAALPTLFLFAVMLLLPLDKLRVGQVSGAALVRIPGWRQSAVSAGALLAGVVALTFVLQTSTVAQLGQGLAIAMAMLSLVVLTGYGGDVSLGQMSFVGLGALVVASVFGTANLIAIVAAGVVAGLAGLVVAIPALRLRGLYLGLGTLAFAVAMDKLVFETQNLGFGLGGSIEVERPSILGLSLDSERAFAIFTALAFIAMAFAVLAIRRGRFGRLILATRDSPAACGTLGLSITSTRVALFVVSAAMAGVAGGVYAGMYVSVGADQFAMFQSLPLLLLAVIGGVTSVTGALIGGLALGMSPALEAAYPALGGLLYLMIGLGAIAVGRYQNGVAGLLFSFGRRLRPAPGVLPEPEAEPAPQAEEGDLVAAP